MRFKKLLCVIMSLLLAFQTITPALADDSRVYYCNQEEHTHIDECYTIYKVLSCEKEHTHIDECFQVYKFLDCELSEHIHNNKCEEEDYKEEQLEEEKQEDKEIIEKAINGEEYFSLICEKEEHIHEKSCFDTVLNCNEEHEHEKSCYIDEIICEKEEHTHIIDCVLDETPITNYDIEELKEDFESEGFVTLQECNDKLLTNKELEKTTIENIDAMLKSAIPQEGIEPTVLPVTVDGISIEKATMRWLSKSTGSNTPAKFDDLVLVPPDNTMPNQQWQLDFALSGKGFIEPGDLEIVIPAYIWKDREGNQPGRLTLAVPEEPEMNSYGLSWKRVEDTYVITNAKKLSAGEKFMIQGTFRMTYPDPNSDKPFNTTPASAMVDIDTTDENAEYKGISDWLYADILVITPHNQEELSARTNAIRATVNTKVEITSCEKKVANNSDIYISTVPNILDLLPDNPEDYYYVRWYISGKANGNQPYTLTLREELTDEHDGILLGFTNGINQVVNERDGSVDVYTGDDFNATKSTYVWTAYPKSSFPEPNTVYTVTNKVIAEVSGVDDKIVTTKEAVASAKLRTPTTYYIDKVWEYNDDKYDTDLETIMSRRPNSITVGISGSGFTDTLSDDNNWHTEYTENNGRYYVYNDAWESGQGNSNYTNSPRIYYTDGSYSYTETGWGWSLRRKVFDENTNTWTFYNQYLETTHLYGGWVRSATYDKIATNHMNNQVRATTDRDLILLRDNKETTDITYRVVRSCSIIPYTSDGTNLHSNTVRIEMTDHTEYLNNRKLNEDEYYFTFATLPNPTVNIWGGSASGYSNSTKIAAEMWGKVDSEWIKFSEIDIDGNITAFNEATVNGKKLVFPTDAVKQTKLVAKTNADWIYASYEVGIKIKPSEQVKEQVENEFALTDYVMMTSKNDATFSIVNDEDNTVLNSVNDSAITYLHGRNYRLAVDLDKRAIYTKNDKINRQLWFSNTITLNRVSSIYNKSEFEYAVSENMLADSDTGVFYDLLPAGMRVDESSIKSTNANIQNINIIENYKNSGRQLLVINADLIDKVSRITVPYNSDKYNNATYPAYQNQEVWGWEPSTITFNMTYSYDEAQNRGLTGLRNHAAYMADEEQFGNLKYWTGEKDIPNGENHTETLSEVREDVRDLMTNLSSDSDYPNTVYAGDTIRITEIDFSALTSLVKQVSITGSDNWSFGHDNEVNVPEGGKYSYRITLTSGTDTTTSDIIILDSIESYTPIKVTDSGDSNIPVGRIISQREFEENNELIAEQNGNLIQGEPAWAWTGYFRGIDVSEITKMGVDAKVYYSTVKGLDISQYNPDGEADIIPNILLDEDIWSLTPPTNLSEVTGIAIDCRKDTLGEDFKLRENESLIAYIHMKAPTHEQQPEAFGEDYKEYLQNAHAFNNAYMDITQQDYLGFTTHSYDHFDFTQVGIYGLDIEVIKVWDDTNDNDRIRPNNLEIELVANGIDTGRTITLNNETWKGIFDHVIEFDDNGDRINYTIKENNIEDYTSSYTKTTDGNLTTITLTNKHELYKVNYPFSKIWLSEESSGWEVNIPSAITVKLYADDIFTGKTKTITPDENGDWYGEFTNLQKFKDGEEIVYSIKEVYINSDWIIEYDGSTIKNTYYPYGNLIVQKKVINSTPESKDNLFKFVIVLTDKNDNDLIGEFDYIITDENDEEISSGKIKNGDGFELKENWKIEIIEIPSGSKYIVQEKNKDGYSIESENSSNIISSEKVQEAIFTNTYNTQGTTSILGNKTLTGRDITRNQFRFELYEGSKLIRTAANTAEGSFNFGTFTYTTADNGKEFIYTVKEIDRGRDGYTYDTKIYTIKVYPVDNGDGTMTVTKKIYLNDEEVDIIEFNNEYHAEGEIVLKAWKELKGRKLQNEEFEFELLDTDGQIIQTKKNSSDGSIIFDAIHFDETDIGKTYYYTIREKSGEDETVNYDSNIYGYSVYVIDNGNGTLSLSQSAVDVEDMFIPSEAKSIDFATNSTVPQDIILPDDVYETVKEELEDNPRFLTILSDYYMSTLTYDRMLTRFYNTVNFVKESNNNEKFTGIKLFMVYWRDYPEAEIYNITQFSDTVSIPVSSNSNFSLNAYLVDKYGQPIDQSTIPALSYVRNNCRYIVEYTDGTMILNPNWQPTEGELPIFKNTLKDGSLSIQKTTENDENANPDQEFKFKIKLIGEDIENKSYDIEKEILPYNAYLIYDANGGKFSDGETENKFTYLVQNGNSTLTNGEYEEPTREGYIFEGWYEDKEFNTEFTNNPEGLELNKDKVVYVRWRSIAKYAVQIYGIEQDKGVNDEILGITFGPAMGGDFTNAYKAHNPTSITASGNTHRCIHNDSWETIIFWNDTDPYVYEQCISEGCTHSVELIGKLINDEYAFYFQGDGPGLLYEELREKESSPYYIGNNGWWNPINTTSLVPYGTTIGGWGASRVRAMMNGYDSSLTMIKGDYTYYGNRNYSDVENYTGDNTLLAAFPRDLQDAIAPRKVKYDSVYNYKTADNLLITYDKLWLLSINEISESVPSNSYNHELESDCIYTKFIGHSLSDTINDEFYTIIPSSSNPGMHLRSLYTFYNGIITLTRGRLSSPSQQVIASHTPCFTLRGRNQNTQNSISESQNSAENISNRVVKALSNTPNQIKSALRNAQTSVEFINGEAEVTLKKNEKITINNIPAGTTYQIYEETPDGWILVEQRNASGEILPLETSEAEFKNRYQPGITSVQFNGSKFLDNRPASENSFSFELWEGDNLLETVSVLDGGFIQFSVISYTEAGTHHYTIKEVNPNSDTIDYDTHIENITVEVIDNGNGTMSSEVSYDSDGIIFRNNTRPGTLEIKKTAQTTNANKDDEFTFEIEFTNENGTPLSNDENIYWYKKDASGNLIQSRNSLMKGLSKLNDGGLVLENNKNKIGYTAIKEDKDEPKLRNTKNGEGDPYVSQPDDIVQWTSYETGYNSRYGYAYLHSYRYRITKDGILYVASKNGESFAWASAFQSSIEEVPRWNSYASKIKGVVFLTEFRIFHILRTNGIVSGPPHKINGNYTSGNYVYILKDCNELEFIDNLENLKDANSKELTITAKYNTETNFWDILDTSEINILVDELERRISDESLIGRIIRVPKNLIFDAKGGYIGNESMRKFIGGKAPTEVECIRPGYKLKYFQYKYHIRRFSSVNYVFPGDTITLSDIVTYSDEKDEILNYEAVWEYDGKNQIAVNHYQETVEGGEYSLVDTDVIRDTPGTEHSPELKSYQGFHAVSSIETVIVDDEDLVTVNYYYDRDRYNIKFDGNGNTSGQMFDTISCIGGISTVLPKNTYSKKGLVFTGWNTQPDGSGMSFLDQSTVVNIGNHGETITLYAQWGDNANIILPTSGKIYVTCKAGETIIIPDLPYGTKYTIKEVDLPDGWSFDSSTGEIGNISANNISSAEFTNRYSSDGIAYITAHKRIQGDTPQEGQFTFELYQGNTLLQTKTNGVVDINEEIAGNEENVPNPWYNTAPIEFDALHFTQEDIGKTFTYTIKEVNTGDNRINYDTHTETVRITVSDAGGGNLNCNVVYDANGALFTNSLKDGNLQLKKDILNSTEISEDTEFEFIIKLTDQSGNPISGTYPVRIKHKNYGIVDKNVNVEKYSHTSNIDDTGKQLRNYSNSLNTTEVISILGATSLIVDIYYNGERISYDWLSVWKGNYPNYKASSNTTSEGYVTTEDGAPNNTNKFGGSQNGSYTVNGNTLTNMGYMRLTIMGDTVTFGFRSNGSGVGKGYGYYAIITPVDDEGNPLTVVVPEEQGFTETTISNNGTLTLKGGEELEITGLPDGAIYEIIEVEKDGWTLTNSSNTTGTIVAGETANVKFENTYSTQGQFTPTANKIYTNGDLSEETFNFIVMDENGNQVSKGITDENGDIIFDTIYYSQEDDGKIFAYYIQEVIDDREHIIWDEHLSEIIVEVNDNGLGELIATPVITNNDNVFTNEYKTWKISINKQVEGNVGNKEKEFEFTITLTNNIRTITYIKGEETGEFNNDTFTFTLRHGETIEFSGIGDGIEYIITENDYSSENYTTIIEFNGENIENREISGNIEEDIEVRYINTSDVAVPTKVNNTNINLFILVLPIAGLFIIIKRRRRMYI